MAASDPTTDVATPTGTLQGVAAFSWDGTNWQPSGRAGPTVATPTGVLQGIAAFQGGPSWQPSGRASSGVATPSGVLDGAAVYTWSGSAWTPSGGQPFSSTPTGALRGVAAFNWDGSAWQPAAQAGPSVATPYGVLQGVAMFSWTGAAWAAVGAPSLSLDFTSGALDPRITFTRASTGTYFDATGTMQTAATNAPRFDYDPTTLARRGLLIEEARTNICLRSGNLADPAWSLFGGVVAAPVVTANNTAAPDGTVSATRIVYPAVSGASAASVVYQTPTLVSAAYTASIWLRGAVGGEQVYLVVNNGAGALSSSGRLTLTTAWQRFIYSYTGVAGVGAIEVGTDLRDAGEAATSAQTIYAWGAQVEQGAFVTSYIPTAAAAAARAVDVASMPLAGWYSAAAGTVMAEALLPANNNVGYRGLFCLDGGVLNTWLRVFSNDGSAAILAGVNVTNLTIGTMTPGTSFKVAETYGAAGTTTAISGVLGPTTASVSTPATFTELRLGSADFTPANFANGYLRRLTYWPRVLSNTELQSVTT